MDKAIIAISVLIIGSLLADTIYRLAIELFSADYEYINMDIKKHSRKRRKH